MVVWFYVEPFTPHLKRENGLQTHFKVLKQFQVVCFKCPVLAPNAASVNSFCLISVSVFVMVSDTAKLIKPLLLLLHLLPVSSLVTPSTVCEVTVSSAFLGFTAAASFDALDLLSSGLTSWLVLAESDAESDATSISVCISVTYSLN